MGVEKAQTCWCFMPSSVFSGWVGKEHLCIRASLVLQRFSRAKGEVAVSLNNASDAADSGGTKAHQQNSRGCCRTAARKTHHKGLKLRPGFAFLFQESRAAAAMVSLSFTSNSGYKI